MLQRTQPHHGGVGGAPLFLGLVGLLLLCAFAEEAPNWACFAAGVSALVVMLASRAVCVATEHLCMPDLLMQAICLDSGKAVTRAWVPARSTRSA